MNQEKMKFWLTCPYCKRKFGVPPEVVMKYADRLFAQLEGELRGTGKKLEAKRKSQ